MSEPRKANVSVQYNGKNITTKLSEFMKFFSYTDAASGESDSISLNLMNIDKRWLNQWYPEKGDNILAQIITKNWFAEGDNKTFKCGSFTIDDISFEGRPLSGTIGALSIPVTESFKSTERTKTWNSITIKSIAAEIAKRAKISLSYEASAIKIDTIEQSGQTDCEFLFRLCEAYGLAMKVYSNKIVIFDESIYEKKASVATVNEEDMLSWSYNTTLTKTYTGAELTYTDATTGKDIVVKVGTGNRYLKVNERAGSPKDAELKALAKLNNANKKMTTMQITIMANPKIVATSNIEVSGLGKLNGKYAVDKVSHSIGKGYTMQLELRRIQTRTSMPGNEKKVLSARVSQYTIKKGDTLWDISSKHLGSGARQTEIYELNKDIIEEAARERGRANSNNGYYVYPETVITIPG